MSVKEPALTPRPGRTGTLAVLASLLQLTGFLTNAVGEDAAPDGEAPSAAVEVDSTSEPDLSQVFQPVTKIELQQLPSARPAGIQRPILNPSAWGTDIGLRERMRAGRNNVATLVGEFTEEVGELPAKILQTGAFGSPRTRGRAGCASQERMPGCARSAGEGITGEGATDESIAEMIASDDPSPFVFDPSSLTVPGGRLGTSPDAIGDLLRSGGSVFLNFRPEAAIPASVNPNGAVLISSSTSLSYSDLGGSPTSPVPGSSFVFFRNVGGGPLIPDGSGNLNNLERVTLDGSGNEVLVEQNFDLIAQSGGGFLALNEQTGVITQANPAFANVGVVKAAEGSSPIPRDRVFMFYSFFEDVPLGSAGGIGVNRFTPGFEKTFMDGRMSFEGRFPFASTLDSDFNFTTGFSNDTSHIEFGDILLGVKSLVATGDTWAVSAGMQVSIPTADDLKFLFTDTAASGTGSNTSTGEFLRIENDTVHILPMMSGAWAPSDRLFLMGFLQLDFDTSGKTVLLDTRPLQPSTSLQQIGTFNDATFLYADITAGYWMTKDPPESVRLLTGFAPMIELHYNRSLTETDQINFNQNNTEFARVGRGGEHIEFLNLTVGGVFQFKHNSYLSLGFSTPIAGGTDTEFDGEFRAQFTHRFGGGVTPIGTIPR